MKIYLYIKESNKFDFKVNPKNLPVHFARKLLIKKKILLIVGCFSPHPQSFINLNLNYFKFSEYNEFISYSDISCHFGRSPCFEIPPSLLFESNLQVKLPVILCLHYMAVNLVRIFRFSVSYLLF